MLARAVRVKAADVVGSSGSWSGKTAPSFTGVRVTESRAMRVAAYATGLKVIAEDVSSVPLLIYQRTADGRRRALEHPTYTVLHDAPNPEMTSMVFRETLQGHIIGWGNAFAEIVRNGSGMVVQMWPLRPDRTEKLRDDAGALLYRVTLPSGEQRALRPRQVFHLPGLGFDGVMGYPFLTAIGRETVGLAAAQQEYVGRFYQADARPGVYLKFPGRLSPEAKVRVEKDWAAGHAGLSNAHRTAILEEGLDISTIGISPVEQQLLESRKFAATEIAGLMRLAPWKVGIWDRATWANVEDGNIDHWQSALRAWYVRWEQQLNLDVVGLGGGYYAEHLIDAILRGNAASRAAWYTALRQSSAITPDEIRDRENLNRRGGA
ncbi:MAG TPA: phage portal protein, partial [Patescibacteria group bacterium]|nr:phage portal protein [Patescibacteria group bacterium]